MTMRYVPTRYVDTELGYIPVPSEKLDGGKVCVPRADHFIESVAEANEVVDSVLRDGQRLDYWFRVWPSQGDRVVGVLGNEVRSPAQPKAGKRRVIMPSSVR